MAITLSKGQKVSLTKGNPGLKNIVVGLGWDTNKYDGGFDFDLDSAAFLLGENDKVNSDSDFIFYNNFIFLIVKQNINMIIHIFSFFL